MLLKESRDGPILRRARSLAAIGSAAGLIVVLCAGCGPTGTSDSERKVPARSSLAGIVDLDGHPVNPFGSDASKANVFIFVASDCPISNRYAPELRRLDESFGPQGVQFRLVYPSADESVVAIRKHVADFRLPMAAIRDPEHALVRRARVHVTPEAAVFLPDGRLIYHGRIDDQYVDFGKDRPEPTRRDLQQVLINVLAGKAVAESSTRAIGCYIPDER